MMTSRNTVWSSFLILYMYVNGAMVFLLADPQSYLLAATLTAALDLWRHSRFFVRPGSTSHRFIANIFITPVEHARHHGSKAQINYGANLSLWDKMHGTYKRQSCYPKEYGVKLSASLLRKLFYPFESKAIDDDLRAETPE